MTVNDLISSWDPLRCYYLGLLTFEEAALLVRANIVHGYTDYPKEVSRT